MILETSVSVTHLTRLIVREDFIESCRCESFGSYTYLRVCVCVCVCVCVFYSEYVCHVLIYHRFSYCSVIVHVMLWRMSYTDALQNSPAYILVCLMRYISDFLICNSLLTVSALRIFFISPFK
jgi:hypothetical protein